MELFSNQNAVTYHTIYCLTYCLELTKVFLDVKYQKGSKEKLRAVFSEIKYPFYTYTTVLSYQCCL